MKYPQVVGLDLPDAIATVVTELSTQRRWVYTPYRRADAARTAAREPRPTLVVCHVDPTDSDPAALQLLADLTRTRPDVAVVVLAESKLTEDDRPGWAAAVLDLGATAVLYPPVERSVLDDLLATLMAATIQRVTGQAPTPSDSSHIDLAAGDYEAEA